MIHLKHFSATEDGDVWTVRADPYFYSEKNKAEGCRNSVTFSAYEGMWESEHFDEDSVDPDSPIGLLLYLVVYEDGETEWETLDRTIMFEDRYVVARFTDMFNSLYDWAEELFRTK
jgi:hypothetical protein